MSLIVVLDSGPLGMLTNARGSPETEACARWLRLLQYDGIRVAIPEIADYEVRRELFRANLHSSIARLNQLKEGLEYLPLTTETMLRAAEFWARARNLGRPTAHDKALDGDVILAAQAESLTSDEDDVVIATTNLAHFSLFGEARRWQEIR